MPKKVYNDEHFNWVISSFNKYQNSAEMAKDFECKFSIATSAEKMRSLCKRFNLLRNNQHHYTACQNEWLRQHHDTVSYSNLTKAFNLKFGTNVTSRAISGHCYQYLGLKSQDTEKFNNKNAWNNLPIGTEHDTQRGIMVKSSKNKWELKARYIYEKHNGTLEKGYQITQLDGDKNNFNLDNLVKVPVKYMLMLNRNNWLGKGEVSQTAIKFCELIYVMKDKELIP